MIKVKDGYAKLIGATYSGSVSRVLLSNGGDHILGNSNGNIPLNNGTINTNLNADMLDGLHIHAGRNNEANKIVRTDASGYIQAGWINTTSGNIGTGTINKIYCSNDDYIRYKTPANFFPTLANSGNNISITVAGQNRTLTVGYATNTDKLDGYHAESFTKKHTEYNFNSNGTTPYNYVWLCRIGNKNGYSGLALTLDINSRYHKHYQINMLISTGQYAYSSSSISINKSDSAPNVYYVRTANDSSIGYDYFDIYVTCNAWNSGGYKIINTNVNGNLSFTNKCTLVDSVPSEAVSVGLMYSSVNYANSAGNADTLDSYHANGLLTALSNSNNGVSITVGGTTKSISNISVNYANSSGYAKYLNSVNRMDYGWNGVNYFNASLTAGCAAKVNDSPTSTWWHILRFNHNNSSGYYTDLAVPFNSNSLYWKTVRNGTVAYDHWIKVLDSLNYNEFAPTKTGVGASGTWNISISGNAATASKWTTARTLTLTGSVTGSASIDGSSNVSLSTTTNHSHSWSSVTNKPCTLISYSRNNENIDANNWKVKECSFIEIRNAELTYSNLAMNGYNSFFNFWTPDGMACTQFQIGSNAFYYRSKQSGSAIITTNWYKVMDSNNCSVSKSGETLTVKINGTSQSLTNTWRGVQDNLTSSTNTTQSLSAKQGYLLANGSARDNTKLPLSGGTMTGQIVGNNKGGSWIQGRANAALYQPRNVQDDWHPVIGFKTKTGSWEFGSVGRDDFVTFSWGSDSNYNSGTNTTTVVYLRNTRGTIALTSEIPTKSSWNYDDVYSKLGHTHDDRYYTESEVNTKLGTYLPLSGGTMTGVIKSTFNSNTWINGVTNSVVKGEYTNYGAILSMPVKDGRVSISSYPSNDNYIYFGYATTAYINAGTNNFSKKMYWDAANNKLVADTFQGALQGNATTATTATKLSTSSAGSASLPVYFSNGIPVACTKSSIFSNLSNNGDQLSITVAGYNRLLTVAYASRADSAIDADYASSADWAEDSLHASSADSATNADYATNADTLDGHHAYEFALSGHTHTLKLESSTKNSSMNLVHGGKYELTAGNSSIIFTLPTDITSITFSGGLISSNSNTLTQANHSITIGGQTETAGYSTCNIINNLSINNLSSSSTTNLTAQITVNGVTSAQKTITQLHSRFWDVTRNSTTSNISPGNYSATITEVYGNTSGITGNQPTDSWYHVYTAVGQDTKYATQLALGMTTDGIWYRKYSNSSWGSWLTVLHSGNIGNYYWANISISSTRNTNTTPQFSKVMINTNTSLYQLNVKGDSHTTGWSRATNGFYCEGNGVYFTHNGTKGEIAVKNTNEFCWGSSSNILYFNYAASSYGTTVTQYVWNAGSSSSYASHTMGHITLGNGSYQLKRVGSESSWYNGRDKAIVRQTSNAGDYCVIMSSKTANGSWEIGNDETDLCFTYITDSNYNNRNNNNPLQIWFTYEGIIYTSNYIQAAHFYENSDVRYKKILKNLSINSNTIANLPLFDFEWIENNSIGTGTSAQAVQQILPNLVSGTDKLTLDYGVLGTIAGITACKELVMQKSELQQLKEKVKQLEDKLRKYENI